MNELEIVIPNGNNEIVQNMLREIRKLRDEKVSLVESDVIDAGNYRTKKLNAFDAEEKFFKDKADEIVERVATETHVKELLVELAACRNHVKAAINERNEKIRALKEANDPKPPVHTYVLKVTCTDKQIDAIVKKAVKDGIEILVGAAQSDKAVKQIQKWFEENV